MSNEKENWNSQKATRYLYLIENKDNVKYGPVHFKLEFGRNTDILTEIKLFKNRNFPLV